MGLYCKHNYRYTQGHFVCSKCGKRKNAKGYNARKNRNKTIAISVIIVVIIMIPVAYATPIMPEIISPFVDSVLSGKVIQNETPVTSEEKEPSGSYIDTIPNKIKVGLGNDGWLYGEITPYNLEVIENPRYNEIKFSLKAVINDLGYDESVNLDVPGTTLLGDNLKKYTINLRDCVSLGLFDYMINGKKTDTKSFGACYDVDKDVKKFDIMFKGLVTVGNTGNTVKIGTIHIKN